ncbi:hypothetical protein [Microbacterium suwonense]|uniref:DUF4126 domain-containing protein n=1 Tax=Microbacterium suwonense TaxID=683047 RepID=A0ABN6X8Y5_9MICO|nr:hypothetical protein [Microbacterium suwonense]BDZ40472.1 hypothetical protein GCM10025863_30860 [Microbacterium suwonense]
MWNLTPGDIIVVASLLLGAGAGAGSMVLLLRRAPVSIEGMAKSDRIGTAFVAGGAVFVGVVALGNAVDTLFGSLSPGSVTVYNMARRVAQVEDALMALPQIEWASSTAVDVTIDDAPASVSAWLLTADLLPILLVLVVCATAVWLAIGMLHGRPFARRFPLALVVVASAVMVCGLFGQLAAGIARAEAAAFLNAGASEDVVFASLAVAIDLSPIGWGLVIGLLAGAFQLGTRMQNDTEGLV